MDCLLAIDQGTTSTRCTLFDRQGRSLYSVQRELEQHFDDGRVEHDAEEIWASTLELLRSINLHAAQQEWDDELLSPFKVPAALLPGVKDNAADFGTTAPGLFDDLISIGGMAGVYLVPALGAAYLAGLQAGIFGGLDDLTARWQRDAAFEPRLAGTERDTLLAGWRKAVDRVRS